MLPHSTSAIRPKTALFPLALEFKRRRLLDRLGRCCNTQTTLRGLVATHLAICQRRSRYLPLCFAGFIPAVIHFGGMVCCSVCSGLLKHSKASALPGSRGFSLHVDVRPGLEPARSFLLVLKDSIRPALRRGGFDWGGPVFSAAPVAAVSTEPQRA